jgi:hypothetical protein
VSARPAWPDVELDPIVRLRAVAAAFPSAAIRETVLDLGAEEAWAWVTDFERTVPRFDSQLSRVRITRRIDDEHLRMLVWARWLPLPLPMEVLVEPGYCLMRGRARTYLVVMAAVPTDDGRTRFVHCEAIPRHGLARAQRFLQRVVDADVRQLERVVGT